MQNIFIFDQKYIPKLLKLQVATRTDFILWFETFKATHWVIAHDLNVT